MTIKDITQAAAGTFMSRSCASSKFTLINGSQIDEFQEENMILQIDTVHTYTTNIVPKEERGLFWKRERLYEVYMVEYVQMEKDEEEDNEDTEDEEGDHNGNNESNKND